LFIFGYKNQQFNNIGSSLTTRAIIEKGSSQVIIQKKYKIVFYVDNQFYLVSVQLPNSRTLKITIQRVRHAKQIAPANPNSLHFKIPDSFTKT